MPLCSSAPPNRAGDSLQSGVRNIPVTVTVETPNAMADAVSEAGIDVVVLWSLCYETFNIAIHEALAGGAFVVVREAAGNCWPAVLANAPEQGCAVADETALFNLFKTNALSARVQNAPRRRGVFFRGSGATDWLRSAASWQRQANRAGTKQLENSRRNFSAQVRTLSWLTSTPCR